MNLKESYRYANHLNNLLDAAILYLGNKGFVTTTTQHHLRSKANADALDETVIVQKPNEINFAPNDVINLAVRLLVEKEALAKAIEHAKATTEISIDAAVALNKQKQRLATVLDGLANIKTATKTVSGSDYKFNNDGNQTKYFYQIEEVTQIDYDRNDVKALVKKYRKECDEVSSKLDIIEIATQVDFVPAFDINDNFNDIVLS